VAQYNFGAGIYSFREGQSYRFLPLACCEDSFFFFGFAGGLRCFNTIHIIDPAAMSQNAAMHIPNQVPLYHGVESTGAGVGLGLGVTVGVTDTVDVGAYVGMIVVGVGVLVGDAVWVGVIFGSCVWVAVTSGVSVSVDVGGTVGVALEE